MMCQPILSASYSSVMYTGGLGTAMIPKVLSNMLCGLQVCAMAEAMLIGEKGERFDVYIVSLKTWGISVLVLFGGLRSKKFRRRLNR